MGESADIENQFWTGSWPLRLVLGFLAGLFLLNRSPFVGFNDGMSFLYAAETGFDLGTNATSHFLYNNLQHILVKVFFFVPPVLLLTLFSIVCSLIALWLFAKIAGLFTQNRFAIAATTLLLGVSFTFWQQSEIIEVYAFNNMLFLSYVWLALRDVLKSKGRANALFVSLLLGIGLLTHIQHILSIPFFLIYLWKGDFLSVKRKVLLMLPWMSLMSILFILPMALKTHSLGAVFVESQFKQDVFGLQPMVLLKGIGLGLGMLLYNFILGLVFVAMGWRRMLKESKESAYWLLALLVPYAGFAFKYSVNDNHVFFLCAYFILLLPAVLSLEKVTGNTKRGGILGGLILVPIATYWMMTIFALQVPQLAKYDELKAYKGGVHHLFWPGKASAPDPLQLALEIQHDNSEDAIRLKTEWNYETAIQYLEFKGLTADSTEPFIYFEF